jgi:RNA polymerase subunit RPABC4/transcription elongation factor Spt4
MPNFTLPSGVVQAIQVSLFILGAYAVAFYLGLVVWTARDISSRTRDWLVRTLAVLLVLVFNLPGLLLYFVLRPRETLAELYERALEEEALLQDIEDQATCPSCKRRVAQDFAVCPYCRTALKTRCPSCRRLLNPRWEVCPYCGHEPAKPAPAAKGQAARPDEARSPAT